jgi:MraZ protein
MFLGNHEASFDAKNRVNFPAKLRDKVPDPERRSFILACHPDHCLVLYTQSEWARITRDFDEKSRTTKDWDPFMERLLFANATEVDLDGVGRILVPEKLKRWAGLQKNVVFAGVRNRIEIWDEDRWNAEEEKRVESFHKLGKEHLK